ncbi:MAG TPA: Uma2 family endonuclease [Candidatus Elarobacter sp.]
MADKDRFTRRSQRGNQPATPVRDDVVSEMQARKPGIFVPDHPITVAEFARMSDAGVFGHDQSVELLDGQLIMVPRMSPVHAYSARRVATYFHRHFADRACVSVESPITLDDISEPKPDAMLNVPPPERYLHAHPTPDETFLVVEVSKSTLSFDRGRKLKAYARRHVQEYWIVNLINDRIDVYRGPWGERYAKHLIVQRGETIAPQAFPDDTIVADEILPPKR